jgi:thiol-disulfide isomerase/thioredoxin
MKYLHIYITTLFFMFAADAVGSEGYQITVNIKGQSNTEYFLAYHFGSRQYLQDTAQVNIAGQAVFSGQERLTPGLYLVVMEDDRNFELIIDQNQTFSVSVDPEDFVETAEFENSPDNEAFYDYIRFLGKKGKERQALENELSSKDTSPVRQREIRESLAEMDTEVHQKQNQLISDNPESLLSLIILAQRDPEMPDPPTLPDGTPDRQKMYQLYKNHFFENIDFTDDRILQTPVYHARLRIFFNNVLMQHPDSIIAETSRVIDKSRANKEMFKYTIWFITNNAESSPMMGMDAVFVHMIENYYMTGEVDWLDEERLARIISRARELKPLLLGEVGPNIQVYDPDSKPITLHDVEADYLVIYFWDSECSFCRQATPKLKEAYRNLRGEGVRVFSVNTETDREKWLSVISDYEVDWIHVNDVQNRSGFRDKYNIYAIPQFFILDKNKKILAKDIAAEHIEQFIRHDMQIRANR